MSRNTVFSRTNWIVSQLVHSLRREAGRLNPLGLVAEDQSADHNCDDAGDVELLTGDEHGERSEDRDGGVGGGVV